MGRILVSATNYKDEKATDTSENGYPTNFEIRAWKIGVEAMRKLILKDKEK